MKQTVYGLGGIVQEIDIEDAPVPPTDTKEPADPGKK